MYLCISDYIVSVIKEYLKDGDDSAIKVLTITYYPVIYPVIAKI